MLTTGSIFEFPELIHHIVQTPGVNPATHVCTEKHLDNLTELYDCMQWQNHTHVGDIHSVITHQNNTQAKLLQFICKTLLTNSKRRLSGKHS